MPPTRSRPDRAALDRYGLRLAVDDFLQWMRVHNYSRNTVHSYEGNLVTFVEWAAARGVERPVDVTTPMLEAYQRALYYRRKPNGAPLTFRTQAGHLTSVRAFFRWAARARRTLYDPAAPLEYPRLPRLLPKGVLTVEEMEAVLAAPDVDTPEGLRDRAVMETLYSTGVRAEEASGLAIFDVDLTRETVFVRAAKGRRERVVPIGARALAWVDRYLLDGRPHLAVPPDDAVLFLNNVGRPFITRRLGHRIRPHLDAAGITKPGLCHLFRHTCATHMLEGGADLRYVQEMLGHADVSTTQIYTQVSIRQLKAVHTATHPGATNARHRSPSIDRTGDDELAAQLEAWLDAELAAEVAEVDEPAEDD